MKGLKERTDDVSDFERSMTSVQLEMKEVKVNMNRVAEALSKITNVNRTIDRKFEERITKINEGLHERDLKTDKQIERRPGIEDKCHGKKRYELEEQLRRKYEGQSKKCSN